MLKTTGKLSSTCKVEYTLAKKNPLVLSLPERVVSTITSLWLSPWQGKRPLLSGRKHILGYTPGGWRAAI
jgi:hypothetical protein